VSAGWATASFTALGTTARLCVAHGGALAPALAALKRELDEVDRACSRFRADSELSRLNRSGGRPLEVGERLLDALRVAIRAAQQTDGLVDPTVGRGLRLAGYDVTFKVVRERDGRSLRPAFEPAGRWRSIGLDESSGVVSMPSGIELDLGATAKALAADRGATVAAEAARAGVLVSLGGDVAAAGDAPAHGWPVLVAEDHAAPIDSAGPVVAMWSGGLASSSTTLRRWSSSAGELHHVLDPRTGAPAEDRWRVVTVAAASCVDANVASTAAIVLGNEAPRWLVKRGLPSRLVGADGEVAYVGGWPQEAA
jgi:thiamine biosynthesis lipoprotein